MSEKKDWIPAFAGMTNRMNLRNRTFRWWWERLALALVGSMVLAWLLLASGLVLTTHVPPGGLTGPLCFRAGGLFSPGGLIPYIQCIGFPGADVAGYLLTRGLRLTQVPLGFILLLVECIGAVPVAWALGKVGRIWRSREPQLDASKKKQKRTQHAH
ncbi:MAG: hypothetical protein H6878_03105 [Rhodobiaceae bacterium]|nr:hypothetical protein [Rhodobiaceae bacterium]